MATIPKVEFVYDAETVKKLERIWELEQIYMSKCHERKLVDHNFRRDDYNYQRFKHLDEKTRKQGTVIAVIIDHVRYDI